MGREKIEKERGKKGLSVTKAKKKKKRVSTEKTPTNGKREGTSTDEQLSLL